MWVPIKNYEGRYEVSSLGRVRAIRTYYRSRPAPYFMALSISSGGYLLVVLSNNGQQRSFHVHRLVAEAFLPREGSTVNHKDGCKTNNKVENLEFVTAGENLRHAWQSGLRSAKRVRKSFHPYKITNEQALEIYRRATGGERAVLLAAEFNISRTTVTKIKNKKTLLHLWAV